MVTPARAGGARSVRTAAFRFAARRDLGPGGFFMPTALVPSAAARPRAAGTPRCPRGEVHRDCTPVSKTGGSGFESYHPCPPDRPDRGLNLDNSTVGSMMRPIHPIRTVGDAAGAGETVNPPALDAGDTAFDSRAPDVRSSRSATWAGTGDPRTVGAAASSPGPQPGDHGFESRTVCASCGCSTAVSASPRHGEDLGSTPSSHSTQGGPAPGG